MVPLLFLLQVALWFILRGDLYLVLPCFVVVFSVVILIREERAGLYAFRAFVSLARVGLCIFPLPIFVSDWLRLVILDLSFYLFF